MQREGFKRGVRDIRPRWLVGCFSIGFDVNNKIKKIIRVHVFVLIRNDEISTLYIVVTYELWLRDFEIIKLGYSIFECQRVFNI